MRAVGAAYQTADDQNHLQDLGDAALVEEHHLIAALGEVGGDIALQVGKRQDEVRRERLDLLVARVSERRYARLAARFGRAHGVAGHTDHAVAFTQEVQRLGGLLRQAHDAPGIAVRHAGTKSRHEKGGFVTATPVSIASGEANIGPAYTQVWNSPFSPHGSMFAGRSASSEASNSRPQNEASSTRVSTQARRARRPPSIISCASCRVEMPHRGKSGVSPVPARWVSR